MVYNDRVPFVNSVFHPSDFTPGSEKAFAHALAIALIRKTRLTILHAGDSREAWMNFPAVRKTLENWGMLEKGSERAAVFEELSLRVQKVAVQSNDPLDVILDYLDRHPMDLIVLATEGREGLPRWLRPSIAEKVSEESRTMTLFVPVHGQGFVSPTDGTISLERILVPVDADPDPVPALNYATRAAGITPSPVDIHLLNIGDGNLFSGIELPMDHHNYHLLTRRGDVVDVILETAKEKEADLIVMATAGKQGILDALRGSITQRVLRHADCPVLAVPSF